MMPSSHPPLLFALLLFLGPSAIFSQFDSQESVSMEAGGYRTKLLPEQPELTEKPEQPELPEKLLPEVKTNHELIDPKNPECIDTKFRNCKMIVIKWRYDVDKGCHEYQACGARTNAFNSRDACESTCANQTSIGNLHSSGAPPRPASPHVNCGCQCASLSYVDSGGVVHGNCRTVDSTGARWCYVDTANTSCIDLRPAHRFPSNPISYEACAVPPLGSYECSSGVGGEVGADEGSTVPPLAAPRCPSSPPSTSSAFPVLITRYHVTSTVQLRYSTNTILAEVSNPDNLTSQQAAFSVTIPERAFIMAFSMEVDGHRFEALVKDKAVAKEEFEGAVTKGLGAGLVAQDVRDSTKFTVSTSLVPGQAVIFRLIYEELLERREALYHMVITTALRKPVEDFMVRVIVQETLPITVMEASTRSDKLDGKELSVVLKGEINGTEGEIRWTPSVEEQKAMAKNNTKKFEVRYEVDRKGQESEVLVVGGYFVHFFVPDNLTTMPKHAIFVLDVSGSMKGQKLIQMKEAMFTILNDMTEEDSFSIITFESKVHHFALGAQGTILATKYNKRHAMKHIMELKAHGGTNINDALLAGIKVGEKEKERRRGLNQLVFPATILVFLSDGIASNGETNGNIIEQNIKAANMDILPIYSIGFGQDADFRLIKGISEATDSFARRVYEDSDATLQLEKFFDLISSPVVTGLKFKYEGLEENTISDTSVNVFNQGCQFVVTGKVNASERLSFKMTGNKASEKLESINELCDGKSTNPYRTCPTKPCPVRCKRRKPPICSRPKHCYHRQINPSCVSTCLPVSTDPPKSEAQVFMRRLHAFLNVKQLMKKDKTEEAKEVALKNNFVTPMTSLLVVKQCEGNSVADVAETSPQADLAPQAMAAPRRAQAMAAPRRASRSSYSRKRRKSGAAPSGVRNINKSKSRKRSQAMKSKGGKNRKRKSKSFPDKGPSQNKPKPAPVQYSGPCKLYLYGESLHRGENRVFTDSSTILWSPGARGKYNDWAVSAKVMGGCCWKLYEKKDMKGKSKVLEPGQDYRSGYSLYPLLKDVTSVKKLKRCP